MRHWFRRAGALALVLSAMGGPACAQQGAAWPTQPIRVIVPSAAGGTTDFLARVSGEFLSARLGQPVIVENNTGAGGNVGTASVARAAPDGHTLGFISTNNLAINQFLFRSLPYDPIRDLAPVAVVAEAPQILVVAKGANFRENTKEAGWNAANALDFKSFPALPQLIAGYVNGRDDDRQVTCFLNNLGLGYQFAAAGSVIYKRAVEAGAGHSLPTDWFTETVHP